MGPARKKQRLSNGSAVEVAEPVANEVVTENTEAPAKTDDSKTTPEQQQRSLFVRSLPATATSESLTELFSESYPVKHAVAVTDKETKQCRGFGFVTFADAEDAARAKAEFNGHVLEGRKLRVEIAERRHREGEEGAAPKAKREQEVQQPPKLIVRNLPWTIKKDDQLGKLFQSYGKVKQAYLPKRSGGLLPGFGFVVMRGRKNAEKAIEGVNGKEVDGRTIAVDWAVAKEEYNKGAEEDDAQAGVKNGEVAEDDEDEDAQEGGVDLDEDDEDMSDDGKDGDDDASGEEEESTEATSADHDEEEPVHREDDRSSTLFIRNLPFSCSDEDLEDHFTQFGSTRYARVVVDAATERPKGTGFVCFYNKADADACLREAPVRPDFGAQDKDKKASSGPSILQNTEADPTGKFTLDGRVLQVARAVNKSDANRLTEEGTANRNRRDRDKRRLYLLSEGTISTKSKLWESLPPSERTMREASAKQRKTLIESNPSLNMSLTRLSVRNIPRSIDSKALKQLAREAVVGFATDVKNGTRQKLAKAELERGGEEMLAAEKDRKAAGKGIVKQAKVVFEGEGGGKVTEDSGAGRSRGYGFIEYYTHRSALMGLRWLNGHAVGYQVKGTQGKSKAAAQAAIEDKKKRLIVEFAIENAQVVHRRQDRETKARERSKAVRQGQAEAGEKDADVDADLKKGKGGKGGKRKRGADDDGSAKGKQTAAGSGKSGKEPIDEKTAKRNQIIGRKRAMRRSRQGGKK